MRYVRLLFLFSACRWKPQKEKDSSSGDRMLGKIRVLPRFCYAYSIQSRRGACTTIHNRLHQIEIWMDPVGPAADAHGIVGGFSCHGASRSRPVQGLCEMWLVLATLVPFHSKDAWCLDDGSRIGGRESLANTF